MQRILARNETLVSLILLAFCVVTASIEPSFLSLATLFDLLRNSIVPAMFAVGVLLVLASGGIDVSFTAIAAFAMYVGTKAMIAFGMGDSILIAFLVAGAIGLVLGLINGFFIATLGLPTLIVTLGTLSVFRGFLLTFVGTQLITAVPTGMRAFSRTMLIRFTAADGTIVSLPMAFLLLVIAVALTWLLLNRTMLGRSIYALGGRPNRRCASASTWWACSILSTHMSACFRVSPASFTRLWRGWRTLSIWWGSNCRSSPRSCSEAPD